MTGPDASTSTPLRRVGVGVGVGVGENHRMGDVLSRRAGVQGPPRSGPGGVQRGGAPAIRGRIDRPCEGTFRGGAPWTSRFRRQHDLTFAQRSWQLRRIPPAEHASAEPRPLGTVPVAPPLYAAASKTHRPPRRASSHRAHRPTPPARASGPATSHVGHDRARCTNVTLRLRYSTSSICPMRLMWKTLSSRRPVSSALMVSSSMRR